MKYRQLGKSGLIVSELALGTMLFGETGARGTAEKEAIDQVHLFLDQGGNHIDCANVYAGGVSEEITGKAIGGRRDQVVLATKVRFPMSKEVNDQGLSRRHIIASVEASLRRLNTDYLDLLYMHSWDPLTPIEESLRALDDLVKQGKIRYAGVSNFKAWQMMKALGVSKQHSWVGFIAAQYQYSLVKRDLEYEFTDLCESEGVGLVPWGPLGGGFLSGKYRPDERPTEGRISTTADHTEEAWERRSNAQNWAILEQVMTIAAARSMSIPQVALLWVKQQPAVSSVILGARTMAQLKDNLQAQEQSLTGEELQKLNEVSQLPELYPYRMIEAYAQRELP